MKVLHVTTIGEFSKLGIRSPEKDFGGGLANVVLNCCSYAKIKGVYESYIICVSNCAFLELSKTFGFNIEVVPSRWIKLFGRPIVILLSIKRIIQIIRKENIDIVHAYNFAAGLSAGIAARICRLPMIICVHQDISDYISQSKNYFVRFISSIRKRIILSLWRFGSIPLARKILPVSKYVSKSIQTIGIAPNKIEVVYNGLNFDRLKQIDLQVKKLREEFNISDDIFLVGSVGRLVDIKGYEYLISAARALLEKCNYIKFILVGDGAQKEYLEKLVAENGLKDHIIFAGFRKNVPELLSSFDLFVLPSLSEGLPTVILEAMWAGVPVIATDIGGIPEIVTDGETGFLVKPKDPDALIEKMILYLRDRALRRQISYRAKEFVVKNFSVEQKVLRLNQIYTKLASASDG